MSSFNMNDLFEELGIDPIKTDYVSPITGEVVKRCAPTSLKDSYAIVSANLQKYYDSKPKPVMDTDYDDYDDFDKVTEKELTYYAGETVCKVSVGFLLQYLTEKANDYSPKTLFVERIDTKITYGEITPNGQRVQVGSLEMSNNNVLHAIYELMRVRFADNFKEQVTMSVHGWDLTPFISEETEVEVSSNRISDAEWIREERDYIQERKRKNKGLLN